MKFSLGAIALLLAAFLTGRSFAADPSGTWRWEHQDPAIQKKVKDVLKIKYENGKVSGTYQGGADLHEIQKAKVEGNQLSWEFKVDIGGNTLNVAFSGKINGDAIKGTVTLGDLVELPWTAKRDGAAGDPSGTWRWEHQDPATPKTVKEVLKIKYENGKVSGTYQGGGDFHEIKEARFEDNNLSWEYTVDIDGNSLNVVFSGEISGAVIKGTVSFGALGEFPWTAKRDGAAVEPSTGSGPEVEQPTAAALLYELNIPNVVAKSLEEWSNIPPHIREAVEFLLQGELEKLEATKEKEKKKPR